MLVKSIANNRSRASVVSFGQNFREAYAQAITVASEDAKEGIAALLEKRDPAFKGR